MKEPTLCLGDKQQDSFDALKKSLSSAPVLVCPDFSKPFKIQADASGLSISAVSTQVKEVGEHPIVFLSRMLTDAEKKYTVIELECLAAV